MHGLRCSRGEVTAGFGNNQLNFQRVHAGHVGDFALGGDWSWGGSKLSIRGQRVRAPLRMVIMISGARVDASSCWGRFLRPTFLQAIKRSFCMAKYVHSFRR